MKSVVCIKPGEIQLQESPEPIFSKDMVKVRIRRVGICGTDFHIYEGSHPFLDYPRVMGHELSGEVAEVDNSARLKVGDNVIINPYIPCGKCIACRKQKPNCCAHINVLGVHLDGGMCEYINVPESQLYRADGLSLTQAAMVEFLSIGAHGVRRGEVSQGDRVLIVGAGPIGFGAAIFASLAGANVSVLDISPDRVSCAENLVKGVQGFVVSDDLMTTFLQLTANDLFDVVIDATGNKKAMENSLKYVAHGGSCVFVSVIDGEITFQDPLFHSREMRLIASRNATSEDFKSVIAAIKSGIIPVDKLHTHSAELSELPNKFPAWLGQQSSLIKAIVHL